VTAADVHDVLDALAAIDVRVDGGWGIDALVGEQTREHGDLDLTAPRGELGRIEVALSERGYVLDGSVRPGPPARFVFRSGPGRQVDVHPLEFDARGNGWQRLGASAWGLYPVEGLGGSGRIGGRPVRCITPELQLRFYLGWEWGEKAEHDVRLLGRLFGLPVPPGHGE
jgi:lincosamide nucleotidyltransferase A/C/D/E